ncbi:MAG: DUF4350 domain-containing protein [Planctomycetes bacterium]|nr:DUF4350 domain-containing protein [Planctomycetota bacterium]
MTRSGAGWSRRFAVGVAVVGAVSLLTAVGAAIFLEPDPPVRSNANDTFSRSALGYAALVEFLRERGHEVDVSRSRAARFDASDLLVLLEPQADEVRARIARGARTLVVLPKLIGLPDVEHPDWVGGVEWRTVDEVGDVLAALDLDCEVARSDAAIDPGAGARVSRPSIVHPQLIVDRGGAVDRWLTWRNGVLLGRALRPSERGGPLYVLADPEPLQHHGLGRPGNAEFVAELFDELAPPGGRIVIDEVVHGHAAARSFWAKLGRFPNVLAFAHGVAAIAAWLVCGMRRFGAIRPEPPALGSGPLVVVDGVARLLAHGGHTDSVLARYLEQTERRVARAHHLDVTADAEARRSALERIEARIGIAPDATLGTVRDRVGAAIVAARRRRAGRETGFLSAARAVDRWRREMTHGLA